LAKESSKTERENEQIKNQNQSKTFACISLVLVLYLLPASGCVKNARFWNTCCFMRGLALGLSTVLKETDETTTSFG
jgi:hypothetical protein